MSNRVIDIKKGDKTIIIGERINPTGKPMLAAAMREMDLKYIKKVIVEQIENGSAVIDINVGADGVDEEVLFAKIASDTLISSVPLCFDSGSFGAIESALKNYDGRALVNSASSANQEYERMLGVAAEYGAMVILLPYSHKQSMTRNDRIDALEPLLECAYSKGFSQKDILVDAVVMTVAHDKDAPRQAVDFVQWCDKEGFMTIAGISNVSFGLPNREKINNEFLGMLCRANLTAAIAKPNDENNAVINAAHLLSGKDEFCLKWIENYK